jgi:hypothetical protein
LLICPDSCFELCTLKASPWRTTFKIFVSITDSSRQLRYPKPQRECFFVGLTMQRYGDKNTKIPYIGPTIGAI